MARREDEQDEGLSFPHLVKWAEMVTRAETERVLQDLPVSSSQLFVLVLLGEMGEATSAQLARRMRITPQALTTLLKPLRTKGMIVRRTDADHARRMPLRLSAEGEKVLGRARELSPGIEVSLLADFSAEERATLKRLLARIARQFE